MRLPARLDAGLTACHAGYMNETDNLSVSSGRSYRLVGAFWLTISNGQITINRKAIR